MAKLKVGDKLYKRMFGILVVSEVIAVRRQRASIVFNEFTSCDVKPNLSSDGFYVALHESSDRWQLAGDNILEEYEDQGLRRLEKGKIVSALRKIIPTREQIEAIKKVL